MPHMGDWRKGNTVSQAYSLNMPMTAHVSGGKGEQELTTYSTDTPGVIIESVKQQLDGQNTIVRMYECYGARVQTRLTLPAAKHIYLTNLMEQADRELPIENGQVVLDFKPYEIVTVMVEE